MIDILNNELIKVFNIKDLRQAKQILGMQISRDIKTKRLWLSQEKYIEKVFTRFDIYIYMDIAKPIGSPLVAHFMMSSKMCPSSEEEKKKMEEIPYASTVGSIMYAMVRDQT